MPTDDESNNRILEKVKDITFNIAFFGIGLLAATGLKSFLENKNKHKDKQELHKELKFTAPDLNKKYKIPEYPAQSQEFDNLYQLAKPLIQIALLPTEVMVLTPYADKGGEINTVGIGCYFVPSGGNPEENEWIHTSDYCANNPEFTVSGDKAIALVDGSYLNRDYAAVKRLIHKNLAGKYLNLKQLAVAFSIAHNSPLHGKKFCEALSDNMDNFACMKLIMSFVPASCKSGIACRHVHEALLLLNRNDYISKISDFYTAKYDNRYTTSVTQIGGANAEKFREAVENKNMAVIDEIQQKIVNYVNNDGKQIKQIICEEVYNDTLRAKLLCFSDCSTKYVGIEPFALTAQAMNAYRKGNYQNVVNAYEELNAHGYGHSDSIYAIAADSYFKTENYDRCLSICRTFVNNYRSHYIKGIFYLAGASYEKKGDYSRALANYNVAASLYKDNNFVQAAINRVDAQIKSTSEAENSKDINEAANDNEKVELNLNKRAIEQYLNNPDKMMIKYYELSGNSGR